MKFFQKMRETMRGMTARQKAEYYLEYYGWRTAAVLAVILITVFLAASWIGKKPVVLGILAVNTDGEQIRAEDAGYFDDFLRTHGINPKRSTMMVNIALHVSPDYEDSVSTTNMNTVQVLLDTRSADLFFADKEYFRAVGQSGYLADLRDVLPESVIEAHAEDAIYVTDAQSGREILAGICVHPDSPWMADTGWYQSDAAVGIAAAGEHRELAQELLLLVLG